MTTSLASSHATRFIKFAEEWASASFAVLLHPTTLANTTRTPARSQKIIDSNNLKFAASSIILANAMFILISTQSVRKVLTNVPFLVFLLVGWTLYCFLNHWVLELLKGKCDARRNISVCFLLLSVIYVVSTLLGVASVLLINPDESLFTNRFTDNEFFVVTAASVFTIMNLIYFPLVFVSMNELTPLRSIVYFIVTCVLTLGQFAFLVGTALGHRVPPYPIYG